MCVCDRNITVRLLLDAASVKNRVKQLVWHIHLWPDLTRIKLLTPVTHWLGSKWSWWSGVAGPAADGGWQRVSAVTTHGPISGQHHPVRGDQQRSAVLAARPTWTRDERTAAVRTTRHAAVQASTQPRRLPGYLLIYFLFILKLRRTYNTKLYNIKTKIKIVYKLHGVHRA